MAVLLATAASVQAVETGIPMDQRCIKLIHFWRLSFDLLKNDPVLMDLYVEHRGNLQLHSSLQALAVCLHQFMGTPHELQFMAVASSPLLFKKVMAGTVLLAYIISPKVCIDMVEATET